MANLDKMRARGEKRRARKAARQDKRASKIEARKGLAKGEGAKVLANRKQRRRELFHDAPEGQKGWTKKYQGKTQGQGYKEKFEGMARQAEEMDTSINKGANNISSILNKSGDSNSYLDSFLSGGGFKTSGDSPINRSDMSSNATKMYMKKKGY